MLYYKCVFSNIYLKGTAIKLHAILWKAITELSNTYKISDTAYTYNRVLTSM